MISLQRHLGGLFNWGPIPYLVITLFVPLLAHFKFGQLIPWPQSPPIVPHALLFLITLAQGAHHRVSHRVQPPLFRRDPAESDVDISTLGLSRPVLTYHSTSGNVAGVSATPDLKGSQAPAVSFVIEIVSEKANRSRIFRRVYKLRFPWMT